MKGVTLNPLFIWNLSSAEKNNAQSAGTGEEGNFRKHVCFLKCLFSSRCSGQREGAIRGGGRQGRSKLQSLPASRFLGAHHWYFGLQLSSSTVWVVPSSGLEELFFSGQMGEVASYRQPHHIAEGLYEMDVSSLNQLWMRAVGSWALASPLRAQFLHLLSRGGNGISRELNEKIYVRVVQGLESERQKSTSLFFFPWVKWRLMSCKEELRPLSANDSSDLVKSTRSVSWGPGLFWHREKYGKSLSKSVQIVSQKLSVARQKLT